MNSESEPGAPIDARGVAARLDALDSRISALVRSSKRRSSISLLLAVIGVVLVGFWLGYAHMRFSNEVNPQLVAAVGEEYLQQYLPSASEQLEQSLKANAPHVVDEGETRFKALPARLDEEFQTRARREIDARMPEASERLYESLKASLDAAAAQNKEIPGKDDEARFADLADSLSDTYGTQTLKLVNDVNAQYTGASGDIINGLNLLAEGKNLTPEQKTQRNLIRDFLILARSAAGPQASAGK